MARTENDSWDLASSVGATATMVAAARALATKDPNPLISDPYAEALVRAAGIEFFTKLVDGEVSLDDADDGNARFLADMMAVRTRFYDDFFISSGTRQAVILASGLDSRAYRLPWADGTKVYEIDQPQVIGAKMATMAQIGATASSDLRPVAADLRDDWPTALTQAGFDATQPTAWSAEGLLVYLPPEAQNRLFDDITALSAPGSQLATDYHPDGGASIGERADAIQARWGEEWPVKMTDLFYAGERVSVVDYLTAHGWQVSSRTRSQLFAECGRTLPDVDLGDSIRNSLAVIATRK